jgi:AcrR family transcriptional regulator
LSSKSKSATRRRGRPVGGGNEPEQARQALLDAAERTLVENGYRASTMEVIAKQAGYTRTMLYRHFATRNDLVEALLQRNALRQVSKVVQLHSHSAGLAHLIVEGLVFVATDLVEDPLTAIIVEQAESSGAADLLIYSPGLMDFIGSILEQTLDAAGESFREGVRTIDAANFLAASALSFLLGIVPVTKDPDQIRRYVATFILPAVIAKPPRPRRVFK